MGSSGVENRFEVWDREEMITCERANMSPLGTGTNKRGFAYFFNIKIGFCSHG